MKASEQGNITLGTVLCTAEDSSVQETSIESRTDKDNSNRSGKWVVL